MDLEVGFEVAVAVIISLFLFIVGFLVISYFLQAIGLSKIAKREGNDKHWLAWIPIGNIFLMSMLVENDVHESMKGKYTLIYGIVFIGNFFIGLVFPVFALLPFLMFLYAFFLITDRYSPNGIVHLVIAVVTLGLSTPFQLFRLRNREIVKIVKGRDQSYEH